MKTLVMLTLALMLSLATTKAQSCLGMDLSDLKLVFPDQELNSGELASGGHSISIAAENGIKYWEADKLNKIIFYMETADTKEIMTTKLNYLEDYFTRIQDSYYKATKGNKVVYIKVKFDSKLKAYLFMYQFAPFS
jgi:hypothetical protein